MIEGVWFLSIGTSAPAAYNPLWAAYLKHDWIPKKIVVFRLMPEPDKPATSKLNKVYDDFAGWIERFSKLVGREIEVDTIICEEKAYSEFHNIYRSTVKKHAGSPRAIDITPGRKYASARGMLVGMFERVDHIFYLHLFNENYLNTPLQEIPRMYWILSDFAIKDDNTPKEEKK